MTHHSFGTLSALSPSSLRPSAAYTPPPSPPMDLATPPSSPHQASSSPAAMLADPLCLQTPRASSPQGWNSPAHPQLAALGWQSPEQTPVNSSVSGASLWALGDPVCWSLFREPEDNDPHPGESRGHSSSVDNDEAANLLPKYLISSLHCGYPSICFSSLSYYFS
ncbi:unnamed protein product [Oreochromis niloticus]|nr:unnamed protein product [Mustela putorius furo]